ncbi:MAG: hypothetical protein KatS3mg001_589 [Candidatus Pacearchaeota archaeon]|nr:MAG: hypothetical protein KatS3mg001_589 [Candidatus Pacearchaeota archaeon]
MSASISQIIGKINPTLYAENGKELLKKYQYSDKIPAEEVKEKPISKHELVYDSSSETLEPVYFFIFDMMNDLGLEVEKLVDNFTSSPGSGHFGELGQRATIMQQQATKILGDVNNVLRSILNILYDLKDFRIRLNYYDDLKNEKKRDAALLALKQIWLDKVDIQKGNSSIKAMSVQGGFQSLIHAFLAVKNEKDAENLDLNDVIKRVVKSRILEFNEWLINSERELRNRYELEKNYLRSQVNALKLYSRWAKPYLKAAYELEMKSREKEAALVKVFNTLLLELLLFGKKKIDKNEEEKKLNLPKGISKLKTRDYYYCVIVEFKFRGIPQRISQQAHYVFGGRVDISFKSYSLNSDELKKLEKEIESSEFGDVLKLIEGATTESLDRIQEEINFFLEEKSSEEEKEETKDTSNPFIALFGGYEKKQGEIETKKETKNETLKIEKENYAEKNYLRKLADEKAKELALNLFESYKKAHGMPSF